MKNTTILIGVVTLILNIFLGLLISKYVTFNVCLNSIVIVLTTALILIVGNLKLKDGFLVSLSSLFGFLGTISFILGFFSNGEIKDNWVVIADLFILVLEIILLISANYISQKVK